jgi:hypothetical protein
MIPLTDAERQTKIQVEQALIALIIPRLPLYVELPEADDAEYYLVLKEDEVLTEGYADPSITSLAGMPLTLLAALIEEGQEVRGEAREFLENKMRGV